MTEIREIMIAEVNKRCPDCGKGYLQYVRTKWFNKSKHVHKCDNEDCKFKISLPVKYPRRLK